MSKFSRLRLALLVAASSASTLLLAAGCATLKVPLLIPGVPSLGENWYQRVIQYVVIGHLFD